LSIAGKRISVRPATPADLPLVTSLLRQLWESEELDDYDDAILASRAAELMEQCTVYMMESEGIAVAFASLKDQGDHMLIRHFSLEERERGKGLGRAAFEALEAHAFAGRTSRLYATIHFPGPRAFWEKMGYGAIAYTMERMPGVAA